MSNITIVKTAKQAAIEKEIRLKESLCPECNAVVRIAIDRVDTVKEGLFRTKVKRYTRRTCPECGCVWDTEKI